MRTWSARAPGKLVLFGEYVVLEGAPALVTAVDCFAAAHYTVLPGTTAYTVVAPQLRAQVSLPGAALVASEKLPAEVPPALRLVTALLQGQLPALPPGRLVVDTQAFFHGGHKLGVGSSAAAAAATASLLAQVAHHARGAAAPAPGPADVAAAASPGAPTVRLDAVMAAHAAAQGQTGSGIDVAASLLGGVLRYQLGGRAGSRHVLAPRAVARLRPPWAGLYLLPIFSGESAKTAAFLQLFGQLKARDPGRYWACLEPMAQIAQAACELWQLGHGRALLPLVDAYAQALQRLGEAMGAPVMSPAHQELAALVGREGGVYKPSGAGGGDVGFALCDDARTARRLRRLLPRAGFAVLALASTPEGAQVVPQP